MRTKLQRVTASNLINCDSFVSVWSVLISLILKAGVWQSTGPRRCLWWFTQSWPTIGCHTTSPRTLSLCKQPWARHGRSGPLCLPPLRPSNASYRPLSRTPPSSETPYTLDSTVVCLSRFCFIVFSFFKFVIKCCWIFGISFYLALENKWVKKERFVQKFRFLIAFL